MARRVDAGIGRIALLGLALLLAGMLIGCNGQEQGQEATADQARVEVAPALTTEQADSLSLDRPGQKPTDDLAAVLILETFIQSCR